MPRAYTLCIKYTQHTSIRCGIFFHFWGCHLKRGKLVLKINWPSHMSLCSMETFPKETITKTSSSMIIQNMTIEQMDSNFSYLFTHHETWFSDVAVLSAWMCSVFVLNYIFNHSFNQCSIFWILVHWFLFFGRVATKKAHKIEYNHNQCLLFVFLSNV